MQVKTLVKHALEAWPSQTHVEALPERGDSIEVPGLDGVRIDGHGHVLPEEVDHDLRVLGLGQIITTVAPDGRPIAMAREGVRGTTAIGINAGTLSVCFSPQRCVGAFLTGRVGGMVDLDRRSAWVFSFDWVDIGGITLIARPPADGTGQDVIAGMALQGPMSRPGPGALIFEPGNWMSLEDRSLAPIQDVWTVVDDATQRVAMARGVEMPEYTLDEEGMPGVTFSEA